mgnify:CR=1 FL=1
MIYLNSNYITPFKVAAFVFVAVLVVSAIAIRDKEAGFSDYYHRDFDKAFPALKSKARLGDPQAGYYLGNLYFHGYGTNPDKPVARKWFYESARAGVLAGAVMYAIARFNEESANSCESKLRILNKISQTDNVSGLVTLAKYYRSGYCVAKDQVRATYYYKLALRFDHQMGNNVTALQNKLSDVEKKAVDQLLETPRTTLGKKEFIQWFLEHYSSPN